MTFFVVPRRRRGDVGEHSNAVLLHEEIFGPVAAIRHFAEETEAIRSANDTEYDLVAHAYTGDLSRSLRVSERLHFGMNGLNRRGLISDSAAPFGGMKQSGVGRKGSHEGLMEYLETHYISVAW